jgi:1-deoxy-D-xylulose-5-phosphate synthase
MYTAQLENQRGPFSIRYPRGEGVMADWRRPFEEIEIGTGRQICEGEEVCILTLGTPGNFAVEACRKLRNDDIFPAHYDMRFLKPLDEKLLHEVFSRYKKIITVEDGVIKGGFGSAILEFMSDNNYTASVKRLGIPDKFIEQGSQKELYNECGFDADAIEEAVRDMVKERVSVKVKY